MIKKLSLIAIMFISGLHAAPIMPSKDLKNIEQKPKKELNTDFNSKKDYSGVKLLLETRTNGINNLNKGNGIVGSLGSSSIQIEVDSEDDIPTPVKSVVVGDSIVVYAMYTERVNNQQKPLSFQQPSYGNVDQPSAATNSQPSMNGINIPSNQNIVNAIQDPLVGPLMAQNGINVTDTGVTQSSGIDIKPKHTIILRVGAKLNGWVVESLSSTYVVFYSKKLKKHVKKYY